MNDASVVFFISLFVKCWLCYKDHMLLVVSSITNTWFSILLPRKGNGTISAAGGKGWGGGGGGRISLDCYSIQEDIKVTVHGLYFAAMKYSI